MIEFLYSTDLHGSIKKYEDVFNCAVDRHITLIHLGADLLPKGSGILENQKKFVKGFLKDYYKKAEEKGIKILAHFGNDDLYTRKKYFTYAQLLDEQEFVYNDGTSHGYRFIAYGFVPDYPFGLKTACKIDHRGWWCPEYYISKPVDVNEKGFVQIEDIQEYFKKKGSIEGDLAEIHPTQVDYKVNEAPYPNSNTIISIHTPPIKVGLDVCIDGRCVGSKAVYDWIKKEQPLLVLCGHIHESPVASKVWQAKIGQTVVVQPGQALEKTTIVQIAFNPLVGIKMELL